MTNFPRPEIEPIESYNGYDLTGRFIAHRQEEGRLSSLHVYAEKADAFVFEQMVTYRIHDWFREGDRLKTEGRLMDLALGRVKQRLDAANYKKGRTYRYDHRL